MLADEVEVLTEKGSLAQSVEQLAFNQLVVGSNPTRPTILSSLLKRVEPNAGSALKLSCSSLIAQLVEQMTVNHWVAGSSPARGAILSVRYFTLST